MTTATTQRPPTEADIREALAGLRTVLRDADSDPVAEALQAIRDSDMALVRAGWRDDFFPPADHPGTLWADLRPSEAEALATVVDATVKEWEREASELLHERVVRAVLAFAAAHPDLPRGHWPNGYIDPDAPRAQREGVTA